MKAPQLLIKVILIAVILTPLAIHAQPDSPAYYTDDYLRYDNFIYRKSIHTPEIHRSGWDLSYPVIKLNSDDKLLVSFDDISEETKTYCYKIIHCDAYWRPSDIFINDYIDGFEVNPINDYNLAFNTFCKYVNYRFTLPNEDVKILISGNYLLKIFEDYDEEKLVLSRRFVVSEENASIEAEVKRATLINYRDTHHEIDFTVNPIGYNVSDPLEMIHVVVCQNNRWDNAIYGLKPRYIEGKKLIFNYEEKNIFPAGNEYRYANTKNVHYEADQIDTIYYVKPYYHFDLMPDKPRRFKPYQTQEDLNGKRLITREGSEESYMDADYVHVHFNLPYNSPVIDGNLYVFGELTDWRFLKRNQMKYNYEKKRYELDLFLKQGFYNYEYVFVKDGSSKADNTYIEGSHYEAENDYVIYVYYSDPDTRYDRLIGTQIVNSSKWID